MGQLAVGLAGGAVGLAFGNPALGFTLGTFIGGLLFPPDPIRIEGPRREDLRVSSSTHGKAIPEGFGVIRLAGNMIWTSGIREVQTTTEVGGKGAMGGGPSQEQINYTYFVDASFALAQGPAEAILRIWADGKVIYDVRDPNTTSAQLSITSKPGIVFRTYLGTQTQQPCPTIQAAEGVANTPAFRGTVYVTMESFELTDFGNRIPQITVEVAFKATGTDGGRVSVDQTPSGSPNDVRIDYARDQVILFDNTFDGVHIWRYSTLQEVQRKLMVDIGLPTGHTDSRPYYVDRDDGTIVYQEGGSHGAVHLIDPDSLTIKSTFGSTDGGDFNHIFDGSDPPTGPGQKVALLEFLTSANCFASGVLPTSTEGTQRKFVLGFSVVTDAPALIDFSIPSTPLWIGFDNSPSPNNFPRYCIAEPNQAQEAVFWVSHQNGTNDTVTLRKWVVQFNAFFDVPNSVIIGLRQFTVTTFPNTIWLASGTGQVVGPTYDETDGNLLFFIKTSTNRITVWKYNPVLDQIQWTINGVKSEGRGGDYPNYTRIKNGRMGIANGGGSGTYVIIDTIAGEVLEEETNMNGFFSGWIGDDVVVWDDVLGVFTSEHQPGVQESLEQYFVGRKTGLGESLDSVVTELSGKNVNGAGLPPAKFNVLPLVPDTVRGYAIGRQMESVDALQPLFIAYDFDSTEADDQIQFIKRGGTSILTITEGDIVAAEKPIKETRTQEVELPGILDVGHIDPDMDYQENIARARRNAAPVPTMFSLATETINLAIVFTAVETKEIAERLLFTAWAQRQRVSFAMGDKFIRLVPTDVITLLMDSGTTFLLRILKENVTTGGTVEYEAVIQHATLQVESTAISADTSLGFEESVLPSSVNTRLCMIDAPYARDIDATNRSSIELKYGMAGFISGWLSGMLWDSTDGVNFSPVGRSLGAKKYGVVTNKLPTGFLNLTDKTTVLNVVMVEGALASITDTQFLANEQAALIGNPTTQNWEYVTFRDAVQLSTGAWQISHLMRGRRGTDAPLITENHADGELFILVERATLDRVILGLGELNLVKFYRGVGRNEFIEGASTVALASKGRPLMPHRPHQLTAVVDGSDNIDTAWDRSSRLYYELTNSAPWTDKPLEEDTEKYEIDFYDAPGGSIEGTYGIETPITTPSFEYLKADLIVDIGINNATAQIDVGSTTTFTQAAGSFITDGFVAGMKIETTLFTDGANNGIFTIQTVVALTLTIVETTLVAETGTGDETIDVIRRDKTYMEVFQVSAQVGRGFGTGITTIVL